MLVLSNVSKHYGDTQALAPTDLQVPAGETLVLIGPSGCGKSTLLRLIAGLIQTDSGALRLEGTVLTLSLIHISEPTRLKTRSRMPSSA